MENDGEWFSILDYARFKNISISTIRRYIKADRFQTKLIEGKYFIFVPQEKLEAKLEAVNKTESSLLTELEIENNKLKNDLHRLTEERNDLQMLVNIYEKNSRP
jgi:hypothetical protein